jgi:predicted small secreted protein
MRKVVMLLAVSAMIGLGGCNTVAGLVRDAQAAGQAVEETAQRVRRN